MHDDNNVKNLLHENSFSFKKQFGQNFITDKQLLSEIVERSGVDSDTTVIEIGCGAGTLTRAIAEKAKFVYGYEIDTKLQPVLAQTLAGLENVEIIFKDFLKIRLDELEKTMPEYRVVANLPYYITTPLIMQFIEHSTKCKSLTIMVQEEVADRLCAENNTADYGAITANIALRGECKKIMRVDRTKFYPSPNVDSAVVKIDIIDGRLKVSDAQLYKKVVQAAFSSRRKTLENNLVNVFGLTRQTAQQVITECGIDIKARGETLSPAQFVTLTDVLKAYIK
jgi:16S rRNA (adenine1518-N6/adenine1519-N6)-dimethyltransferase